MIAVVPARGAGRTLTGLPLAIGATSAAAAAVVVLGPVAAVAPAVMAVLMAALRAPRATFWMALAAAVAIDTAPVGSTARFTLSAWELPQSVLALMPFKMSPFEVLVSAAFAGAMLHRRAIVPPLSRITLAIPIVLVAGLAYGLREGGQFNLAYHEARGLIFGTMAFAVAWRLGVPGPRPLAAVTLAATTILGLSTVYRFATDLNGGATGLPREIWFGHETALFLSAGFLLGVLLALRARRDGERALLSIYALLMLAATLMTGRRAGVLVLGVGVVVIALLMLPRRPALLTALAAVGIVVGALYLNAFWDAQAGPVAEPARAVRSQVDPDARDRSSDRYRQVERANIAATLAASPLFGVGFGRPFEEVEPLPELAFWPLQQYTPHENILWLWLKTGFFGATAFLATWMIAFSRSIRACAARAMAGRSTVEPMLVAAVLAMYVAYAHVDLAFVTARAAVPLAAVLAIALARRWHREGGDHGPR